MMAAAAVGASLQGIMQQHLLSYSRTHPLSPRQWQVCSHIQDCRTARMGTLDLACDHCDYRQVLHPSCRDRHCPQCQYDKGRQWSEKQASYLLPVTYHHVVFTLPHELNAWISLHPKRIINLFFRSVWSTLQSFAQNTKHLGGQLGITAVLHTWGENLSRHVHIHCLIPGGAINESGDWIEARSNYLFPVRALSKRFRGCMVSGLREAYKDGALSRITEPDQIDKTLDTLMSKSWAIYSKPCPGKVE